MNQASLAGVGNVYSDEILFQAGIHPKTPADALDEKTLRKLCRTMHRVLETAIQREADVDNVPRTWLLPHREKGRRCPRCGGRLKSLKVSGRTAYCCEQCQA